MTAAELLALAQREALQTTITPSEFLLRVRTIPGYDFKQAHWFKAMQALEQLKHQNPPPKPPPPPPPPGVDLSPVRNLLILATVTDELITDALRYLPPRWRFVFSADRTYWATDSQIQRVKSAGRLTGAWGDCMTTLPPAIKDFQTSRGLERAYGQCENGTQFQVAWDGGLHDMVGKIDAKTPANPGGINDAQLDLVKTGKVRLTIENYRNIRPAEVPDWRNANAGIGGNCGAVYGSTSEGAIYTSAASQIRNGWFGRDDSWYTEQFSSADFAAVGSVG